MGKSHVWKIGYRKASKSFKPERGGYTYNHPEGQCGLYVYRIAIVNSAGLVTDLSWDQVKEFCTQRGLNHVPEIGKMMHKDFVPSTYLDIKLKDKFPNCLQLDDNSTVDDGICVRVD